MAEPVERAREASGEVADEAPEAAVVEPRAVEADVTPSASAGGSSDGELGDEIMEQQPERLPDVESELTVTIIVRNMNNHTKL